jgi:hypothetical protein
VMRTGTAQEQGTALYNLTRQAMLDWQGCEIEATSAVPRNQYHSRICFLIEPRTKTMLLCISAAQVSV